MPLIYVSSLDDARLDAYARLTEAQLRSKLEPERALFIAESEKVIERAFEGGMEPISLLMEEKWLAAMGPLIAQMEERRRATAYAPARPATSALASQSAAGTSLAHLLDDPDSLPVFIAPRDELARLTGFELTRGALGAFRRPALPSVADVLEGARLVAVLEDITNHTNVGAIFRSAAALGIDAVLLTPACHDPLFRRASRVAMGTVFQVPWARIGADRDWAAEGVALLRDAGFATAALALSDDSISVADPRLKAADKLALILGTEGDGLRPTTIATCDYTVRIPMAHGVDSLNVAAASAVAFWETRWEG